MNLKYTGSWPLMRDIGNPEASLTHTYIDTNSSLTYHRDDREYQQDGQSNWKVDAGLLMESVDDTEELESFHCETMIPLMIERLNQAGFDIPTMEEETKAQ
jgi:hypothetical protein